MSGETQLRRNLRIDIEKLKEKAGESDVKFYCSLPDWDSEKRRADGTYPREKVLQGYKTKQEAIKMVKDGFAYWDTPKHKAVTMYMFSLGNQGKSLPPE